MKFEISDFKHGIFDVEGTLIDNKRVYRWLVSKISLALEPNGSELFLPAGGVPLPGWAKLFRQSQTLTRISLIAERKILTLLDLLDKKDSKLFEGSKEVLFKLKQKGILLFATTGSKTEKAISMLKRAGILEFFTLITGSELPKKEHVKLFAQRVNLPLDDFCKKTFLVSDGPVDLNLAAKNKIYGIGFASTFKAEYLFRSGAKQVISNLKELIQ